MCGTLQCCSSRVKAWTQTKFVAEVPWRSLNQRSVVDGVLCGGALVSRFCVVADASVAGGPLQSWRFTFYIL
jgi:hypothetical protein